MSASSAKSPSPTLATLWKFLPSLCLLLLVVVPPFSGTLSFYRCAVFALIAVPAVSLILKPASPSRTVMTALFLGGAFTLWALIAAWFGIDRAYSLKRWLGEHLIVFLLFAAILLNRHPLHLRLILWAGILSTLFI